jgi:hypothetical protein
MQRKTNPVAATPSALAAFLDAHLGAIERNDVGPLLGQAALMRERGAASFVTTAQTQAGLNAALTGGAPTLPWKAARAAPHVARRKPRGR